MATNIENVVTLVDLHIKDTSTNSWTLAERLDAITEATRGLYDMYEFDWMNKTFEIDFFDNINWYNVTSDIPDLVDIVDLRRQDGNHTIPVTRKTPRELAIEIDTEGEFSVALERKNLKNYIGINHNSKYSPVILHDCEAIATNGTWLADATAGDATNLTADSASFKAGSGSINFDLDVSQTANNRAVIYNDSFTAKDLSDQVDLGSLIFWAYIPDVTYTSSITAYWGSSSTNYYSAAATTDAFGDSFAAGWNRVKVDWADTATTGTPTNSAINYLRFDFNYTASQADDTDYRIDDITMVRPEKLTFHYDSWALGVVSSSDSTLVYDYTATSNVPFYSGIYDYVDNYVAHQAAAILFNSVGMDNEGAREEVKADKTLSRLEGKIPESKISQTQNFKVHGLKW